MAESTRQVITEYLDAHDLSLPISGSVREFCRDLASDHEYTAASFRKMYYTMLDEKEEQKAQPEVKQRKKSVGETLSPEDGGASPEEGDWFRIDEEDSFYVLGIKEEVFKMTYREIEDMVAVYVHEGAGLTQVQVARHMWRRHKRKLTADFVRRIFKVLGIVKNNPPLAPHVVRSEDPDKAADLWHEQKLAEIETRYRAKRHKELEKALKEERKKSLRFEDLAAEYLGEQDRKVVEVNANPLPRADAPEHTAIVCLSDWHVGKISEAIGSEVEFRAKIEELSGQIQRYFEWCDQRPVDRLIFAVAGDMLDGTQGDMHDGQAFGQWCHGREQADIAAEALAKVIEKTTAIVGPKESSEVFAVTGNHDRTSKNRDGDPLRTVGGLTYLLAQERSPSAKWQIVDAPFARFSTKSAGFLLAHGDQTPKDPRRLFHGLGGEYKAVITGHYHSHAFSEDYRGLWFQVGSLCGVDEYARRLGMGAMPSQLVISCQAGLPPVSRYIPIP